MLQAVTAAAISGKVPWSGLPMDTKAHAQVCQDVGLITAGMTAG